MTEQYEHYALVKCDLYQEIWKYEKSTHRNISFWKDGYVEKAIKLINKNFRIDGFLMDEGYRYESQEYYLDELKKYKRHWENNLHPSEIIYRSRVSNGETVLWEGQIKQSRLRAKDNLYIPTLGEYKKIKKVEVTPSGSIVYYVEHKHNATDTLELTRLSCVEKWFTDTCPNLEKFEDLRTNEIPMTEQEEIFKAITEEMESKIFKKTPEKTKDGELVIEESKILVDHLPDPQDSSWEKTILVCFIGVIMIVAGLIIFGLS